jgi:Gas vesicle synthesis protein GvpL/GvpF
MHLYALLTIPDAEIILPVGILYPLQLIQQGEIAAVVEPELCLEAVQQDEQSLLAAVIAHDRVIRALFAQTSVLPSRFTSFLSLDELRLDLSTHRAHYAKQLAYLAGKAEYTLKAQPLSVLEDEPISTELKGKDYFLAKKQHLQKIQFQQFQQTEQLQQLMTAIAQSYPAHQQMEPTGNVQTLHLLVEQAAAEQLQQAVLQWQSASPQLQLALSDPLPPYHFVEGY